MIECVRLGVVGLGGMGGYHASYVGDGEIQGCNLSAVCDPDQKKLKKFENVHTYMDSREMLRSGEVDAVLIATPHYLHTSIGIDALEHGLHVLVEKPISVHKADCKRLLSAHKGQVFAAMFDLRTDPLYVKLKDLIQKGELGKITRVNWILTDWFRTNAYYASSAWRGTWEGEGGGVLINQCPHQLDLLCWFFGMPRRVRAFCGFGACHDIEVEDAVTAVLEYPDGATGVFIAGTGECPGTNRLEIVGDIGRCVVEDGEISMIRNEVSSRAYIRNSPSGFEKPDRWDIRIPVGGRVDGQKAITQNFVDAITEGAELIAPARDGINSVELANAMVYSSMIDDNVELPLDGEKYERMLNDLVAKSCFVKKTMTVETSDFTKSFHG